jgi:hypothetical protein
MEYESKQLILRELEAGERCLPSGIEIDFEFFVGRIVTSLPG